jgi:precorrin-4 methylase
VEGKATAEDAMEILAARAHGDVLDKLAEITSPALSPITIMARAYKRDGKQISGKVIGEIASKIKNQRYDITASQIAGVSTKPLNDTGHMIATMDYITERTS